MHKDFIAALFTLLPIAEAYLEPNQTTTMEFFAKIVND